MDFLEKYTLISYDKLDSTNSEVMRLVYSMGCINNLVVVAGEQYLGKGKSDRIWDSPRGGLYLSLLTVNNLEPGSSDWMPFFVGNVVYDSILSFVNKKPNVAMKDLDLRLKWPNDVLINNKKVCGMLCRSFVLNGLKYFLIGVGVNIFGHPDIDNTTSISKEGIVVDSLDSFLIEFIKNFDSNYIKFCASNDILTVRETWLSRAYKFGEQLEVTIDDNKVHGIFKDLSYNGAMRFVLPNGNERLIY